MLGIPRPDRWFDYVRQRFLVGAIPADKWMQHIQECIRACASDGWIEIIESDTQIVDGGPACQQYNTWIAGGLKTRGIDVNIVKNLDELMREAGLINVRRQLVIVPIGPWGRKAGELFFEDFKLINKAIQPLITTVFNMPKEEVERNGTLMMEEFKSYHAYSVIYVYSGQKR
jgi:hypothetical protein